MSTGEQLIKRWGEKKDHYLQSGLPALECSHHPHFSLGFVLLDILYFLVSSSKERERINTCNEKADITSVSCEQYILHLSTIHYLYKQLSRKLPFMTELPKIILIRYVEVVHVYFWCYHD